MTLEDVKESHSFKPTEGRTNWGHINAVCWFRFDFTAGVSRPKEYVFEVILSNFRLWVRPEERTTVFLRLDYSTGITSPAKLYTPNLYRQRFTVKILLDSIVYGLMFGMLVYNLFLFLSVQRIVYLYYVLYTLMFLTHIFLRENYLLYHETSFPLRDYHFSMPIFIFASLFTGEFLDIRKRFSFLSTILYAFAAAAFVLWIMSLTRLVPGIVQNISSYYQMLAVPLVLIAGTAVLCKKNLNGLWFIISWLPLVTANLLLQFDQLGVIQPNSGFFEYIQRYGFYHAAAFQSVTLSLALGGELNRLTKDKERAEKEQEKYKEIDRIKTDLLANVSHEFRTPLTLILGTTESIIQGRYGVSLPIGHPVLNVVRRNGAKLLRMVDNLLSLARLEGKKWTTRNQLLDLSALLPFYLSEWESIADKKKLTMTFEQKNEGRILALLDQELLETIVFNLVSNAVKFTPEGGAISIVLESIDDSAVFTIRDTGCGMEEQEKQAAFSRFYRSSRSTYRKEEGTGIGLSLVKEAITLMKGSIAIETTPSAGTSVRVAVPAFRSSGDMAAEPPPQQGIWERDIQAFGPSISGFPSDDCTTPADGKPRILIVEDNEDLCGYLYDILGREFRVICAGNGEKALRIMNEKPPFDCIVSDLMMPVMDGQSLLQHIRTREEWKGIPFVFLSARADRHDKIELLGSGAIDYIDKPFSPDELLYKIHSIVRRDASIKQQFQSRLKEKILKVLDDPETFQSDTPPSVVKHRLLWLKQHVTERDIRIIELVLQGARDKEIAGALGVATSTVSNTLSRIYKKLKVSSRTELIVLLNSGMRTDTEVEDE